MTRTDILYLGADEQVMRTIQQLTTHPGGEFNGICHWDEIRSTRDLVSDSTVAVLVDCTANATTNLDVVGRLAKDHPSVVRFAVVAPDDRQTMLLLIDRVHQVVRPDVSAGRLVNQVRSAMNLRRLMSNDQLEARIASIDSLPSLPDSYTRIVGALRNPDISTHTVADLISADPAITAKLLQVVNSAYFGLSRQVTSVNHAVNLVGVNTIQSLVLASSVFDEFQDLKIPRSSIEEIFSRSIAVGSKARLLAHAFDFDPYAAENTLIGGMLHDIGRLIMARYFAEDFIEAIRMAEEERVPFHEAADRLLGASDAVMGGYLLSLWGLSDPIIEAVAMRYSPRLIPTPVIGPLTAVHLAWAIDADERHKVKIETDSFIDLEYLGMLGLDSQVEALRGFCSGAVV